MKKPTIEHIYFSVIVPFYNAEKTLERTIQSILNQSFSNYELLLIDDCSTDASFEIALKYGHQYSNVYAIQLPKNSGSAKKPREVGSTVAKGKYVVFVDSDDVVNDVYLESFFKVLTQEKDIDVVIPRMRGYDAVNFRETGILPSSTFDMSRTITGPEACRMEMTQWTFGCNGCCCCELFRDIIKKNPYYYMNSDELTSRLLLYNARRVAFSEKSEYLYYRYENSITHKRSVKLFETLYTDTHLITFAETYFDQTIVKDMCSKMLSNMICLYKAYRKEKNYSESEQKRINEIFLETYSFLRKKMHYMPSHKSRLYLTNWYIFTSICEVMMFIKTGK